MFKEFEKDTEKNTLGGGPFCKFVSLKPKKVESNTRENCLTILVKEYFL